MITVGQLLNEKDHELSSIHPHRSLRDAMKMMTERDIGSLLVMQDARLLGIITERRCARTFACEGNHAVGTEVWKVAEAPTPNIGLSTTLEECMTLMTEYHVRYLPVLRFDRPVGIVSIGVVVKSMIRDQQGTIAHLEHYINGRVA